MKQITFVLILTAAAYGQTSAKPQFEVASIKMNAPQTGFRMAADSASGGPGTSDPAMFRCSKCSLATLIEKAFNLQPYQFPGRAALTENTYEVMAKIPAGASAEQFSVMLQNLLKDRFALTFHFQEKKVKGYHLVIAKNGPKLKESSDAPVADQHRAGSSGLGGPSDSHSHTGAMAFGSFASFRATNQTTADLARVLSDQIGVPVDDQTSLTGKYDISLRWSGNAASHDHADGGAVAGGFAGAGGAGHAGHDGGSGAPSGPGGDATGPTLFDALQQQLGLKMVPAEQAPARLFVVNHVSQRPTEN